MTDFGALLGALARGGVKFLVIGGAAATVHGSARLTQDLDVVYERSPENLQRLAAALAPYAPYLRGVPPGRAARTTISPIARSRSRRSASSAGASIFRVSSR